jgi:hypothetical protein
LKDYDKLTYQEQLNKHEIIKQHLNRYKLKRSVDIQKRIYHEDMHKHINLSYLISDTMSYTHTKQGTKKFLFFFPGRVRA